MIYLEDTFFDHPKVIAAGDEATLTYLRGLAWLKQQRSTTGRIPKHVLPRLAPIIKGRHMQPGPLAQRLVGATLWHDDGEAWIVHDYVERNRKAIEESQRQRERAQKRWSKRDAEPRPAAGANGNATADATASIRHMPQSTVHSPQSTMVVSKSRSSPKEAGPGKGTADAEDPGPDGYGRPEAAGPDETTDDTLTRRSMALRWQDVLAEVTGTTPDLVACNRAVAEALHLADARIVDEQIGWQLTATNPPRTPTALITAVRRITR